MHVECCSVSQWCLTPCDPMDCSTPGFSVLHHLLEFAQMENGTGTNQQHINLVFVKQVNCH